MKDFIKNICTPTFIRLLSTIQFSIKGYIFKNNLNKLAKLHHCDKWGEHYYTNHYMTHFEKLRNNNLILIEIGVGGYQKPNSGGASLRMWKDYFRKSTINAIDIYDKSLLQENRIKIFQGDQTDQKFLDEIITKIGSPDIIIDDGSHVNEHIIKSFNILFPKLKQGGWYVVEDLQTSYWSSYGGNSLNIDDSSTAINYFRSFVNGINHKEYMIEDYQPTFTDLNITEIHFYHNIVFIRKNKNNEPSNYLINNKVPKGYE